MNSSEPLNSVPWEKFAQLVAAGTKPSEAYVGVYGDVERKKLWAGWNRLIHHPRMMARVKYLTKDNPEPMFAQSDDEVNLKSVIKTCRVIIDGDFKTPDKLSAINTLNKLGVFDNETKDDTKRMDPAALCEYLAQFAGAPAKELGRIPGGLKGLMVRLMELTGASRDEMRDALNEAIITHSKPSETPMLTGAESPAATDEAGESEDPGQRTDLLDFEEKPDDDELDDEGDETLKEVIDAPQEPEEMSPEMRERLAPALEFAGAGKVEF